MALYATADDPEALWAGFKMAISKKTIETWRFHKDGVHFTHTVPQWSEQAWFKAVVRDGRLVST